MKYYGVAKCDIKGASNTKIYKIWHAMIQRCYDAKHLERMPHYEGSSVCEEWKILSNFKKWFDDPNNGYVKGYFLDKDVRVKGNKVYSPETCCFLPPKISSITTQSNALRGALPIGVSSCENKFRVRLSERNKLIHSGTVS